MTSGLCVTGLAVERSGKPVIHGVDVAIAPGQITALLGANGAGKSSLVLTIAGALPAARAGATAAPGANGMAKPSAKPPPAALAGASLTLRPNSLYLDIAPLSMVSLMERFN